MTKHLADLEQALANAGEPAERVRALNALATELARTGHARRAIVLSQQAREQAVATGDPQLDAEAHHALARCHFYLGDFMPALEALLAAAQQYQALGDLAGAATAFAGVGLCQHRMGAHDDAVASLLRALESARGLGLHTLEINTHNSLGSALIFAERLDEAAGHLDTGIALARAADNRNLLSKLLHNQSLLAMKRGETLEAQDPAAAREAYAQGLAQVEHALALVRELDNLYDQAHCLGQSGTMLRRLGRFEAAGRALREALELGRALDEQHLLAEALMELGRLHRAEGAAEQARRALAGAIELARRIGARALLAEACETQSQVLEDGGEHAQALALYKEYHALRAAELAGSRKHAAAAAQLWLDFQDASRRAALYRQRAETLAADHEALARRAEVLAEVSQRDPLTGLLNRRGLEARVVALLAACEKSTSPLTLALIDVDHFKRINDRFSHAVGDAVLCRVAELMRAQCRADDLPVRQGGDEFLLVLARADLDTGLRVVQRLRQANAANAWNATAQGLQVTLSIGVSAHESGRSLEATLAAADAALYRVKRAGRDGIAAASGAPGGNDGTLLGDLRRGG